MIEINHIDCMEYMPGCSDNQFDLAICDPPYFNGPEKLGYYGASVSATGIQRTGFKKTKDWNVPEQNYFDELKRISKHQIIWGINYYNIKNLGSGRIIWDKVKDTGMTELRGVFVKTEGYYRTKEKVINFLKKTYKNK